MLAHGLLPLQVLSYGPPDGTKTRPIIGRWQLLKSGLQATRGFEFVKLNNLLRNWLYDFQFVYRRNDGSSQLYMSSYLSPQFKHIHLHSSPFSGILRTNNETSSQFRGGRALHRYHKGHGFESRSGLNFLQAYNVFRYGSFTLNLKGLFF